ncbi:hypothetical protein JOF46_003469 [Paeniglutamicibacter psychrophenolicus]|uniref:Uncharacterized protein n=1 Tax=Paeniglutamicibacter psychrophenolicus TaxID=257454 RepID=A0ABS4WH82_9MICC|nr:hypothetical protein [Paeniglutamicibacter psychrophenolicus]
MSEAGDRGAHVEIPFGRDDPEPLAGQRSGVARLDFGADGGRAPDAIGPVLGGNAGVVISTATPSTGHPPPGKRLTRSP